jgi:cysteine-rich repeat protein
MSLFRPIVDVGNIAYDDHNADFSTARYVCSDNAKSACGDGLRRADLNETCDDGNVLGGDGCSSGCSVEPGYVCAGGNASAADACRGLCERYNMLVNPSFEAYAEPPGAGYTYLDGSQGWSTSAASGAYTGVALLRSGSAAMRGWLNGGTGGAPDGVMHVVLQRGGAVSQVLRNLRAGISYMVSWSMRYRPYASECCGGLAALNVYAGGALVFALPAPVSEGPGWFQQSFLWVAPAATDAAGKFPDGSLCQLTLQSASLGDNSIFVDGIVLTPSCCDLGSSKCAAVAGTLGGSAATCVDCTSKGLTALPVFPASTTVVLLDGNTGLVPAVSSPAFRFPESWSSVRGLSMESMRMPTLSNGVFAGLASLEAL